jgi:hypothetical protein
MPYQLVEATKNGKRVGFYVRDYKTKHKFSKNPLSYEKANKQRIALAINESKKSGFPVEYYFIS